MNAIFTAVLLSSIAILTFVNPESVFSAMISGGEKAINLTVSLIAVYAVNLGLFQILKSTALDKKIAKAFKPINKFLFGDLSNKSQGLVALNLSANFLGISGATTPLGISATTELANEKNARYKTAMFFVLNATSVQIVPLSVITLRASFLSSNPIDIFLPSLLSTAVSTVVGVILVKLFIKK